MSHFASGPVQLNKSARTNIGDDVDKFLYDAYNMFQDKASGLVPIAKFFLEKSADSKKLGQTLIKKDKSKNEHEFGIQIACNAVVESN